MTIPVDLAMTAGEMQNCPHLPRHPAWMACHFSPSGSGLCNLPAWLPEGAVIMLDDAIAPAGHDPQRICQELSQCQSQHRCAGVLLDFQRPDDPETARLAAYLTQCLPCPVTVTAAYAQNCDAAVLLPPLPHDCPLDRWAAPWKGRQLWLELDFAPEIVTLSRRGADRHPGTQVPKDGFPDPVLCCHYTHSLQDDQVVFTLWRTREDWQTLLEKGRELGIVRAVGLYQQAAGTDLSQ